MKEFKVNDYISLLLINEETIIYVNNNRFLQCKFLLLNIPIEEISSFDDIKSVDEAAEKLDKSLEPFEGRVNKIPPDVEFWGHCSNLQVWYEHNHDTRLLHRNLAFPLLKKLSDVGDPLARRVFKDEIIKRIKEGTPIVLVYLIIENYFKYFKKEELKILIKDSSIHLLEKLQNVLKINTTDEILIFIYDVLFDIESDIDLLKTMFYLSEIDFIKNLLHLVNLSEHDLDFKEKIQEICNKLKDSGKKLSEDFYDTVFKLFMFDSDIILYELISLEFHEYLKKEEFLILFNEPTSKLRSNLLSIAKNKAGKYRTNRRYLYEQLFTFLVILCKNIGKVQVFQFLIRIEREIKGRLEKGMRDELNYLKHEASQYYLEKKELEEYILEFLEVLKE